MQISGASQALQGFSGIQNNSVRPSPPAESPARSEPPAAQPKAEAAPREAEAAPERREAPPEEPRADTPRGSVVDIKA